MGIDFEYIQGQTPLDADEIGGLLIPSISTVKAADTGDIKPLQRELLQKMQQFSTRVRARCVEALGLLQPLRSLSCQLQQGNSSVDR